MLLVMLVQFSLASSSIRSVRCYQIVAGKKDEVIIHLPHCLPLPLVDPSRSTLFVVVVLLLLQRGYHETSTLQEA